jgi:hypothetical protein
MAPPVASVQPEHDRERVRILEQALATEGLGYKGVCTRFPGGRGRGGPCDRCSAKPSGWIGRRGSSPGS